MEQTASSSRNAVATSSRSPVVRQFHQVLIWPVQILADEGMRLGERAWTKQFPGASDVWRELDDEFTDDPRDYQERHYREFVAFLPHVQRFLYGERPRGQASVYGDSPIRIYRRYDLRKVRCWLSGDETPIDLELVHCDLYFFLDVDVAILALEVRADDLPLPRAQEVMLRLGRAYPGGWTPDGAGQNCFRRVEWLDAQGRVLSASDYEDQFKFKRAVCESQSATIAAHWEFLMRPLAPVQAGAGLRYRLLEYYRMPLMAYLALEDVAALARADHVRLALAAAPGETLPMSSSFLWDFEKKYCYDRFWEPTREDWASSRILCSGHAVVALGDADKPIFTDAERGFLAQFRHQLFGIAMMAHFHRAALLMFSDRLVNAMSRLNIHDPAAVRLFRRDVRLNQEVFLRFTQRYYFSDVSDQALARDLFKRMNEHLGTEKVYAELRGEIHDMSEYLETDMLRRQAVTILRLTVVTLFSLIGNITTGFLGMNLFNHADMSTPERVAIFFSVFIPAAALTMYAVWKSQRLSMFLDAVADERASFRSKLDALADVWRRQPRGPRR